MNTINKQDNETGFFAYYFYDAWFKNYSNYEQGISRKQFWIAILLMNLFLLLGVGSLRVITGPIVGGLDINKEIIDNIFHHLLCGSYFIFAIIGMFMVVRRLRDINKSGIWLLGGIIPFIGWIWLTILVCLPGQEICLNPHNNQLDKKIWSYLAVMLLLTINWFILK